MACSRTKRRRRRSRGPERPQTSEEPSAINRREDHPSPLPAAVTQSEHNHTLLLPLMLPPLPLLLILLLQLPPIMNPPQRDLSPCVPAGPGCSETQIFYFIYPICSGTPPGVVEAYVSDQLCN